MTVWGSREGGRVLDGGACLVSVERTSSTNSDDASGRLGGDQRTISIDDRLGILTVTACGHSNDGDVGTVDGFDDAHGIGHVQPRGIGCSLDGLAGARVGDDLVTAGGRLGNGLCADHACCTNNVDLHENSFNSFAGVAR